MTEPTPTNIPSEHTPPFNVEIKQADLPTKREIWRIGELENHFGPNYIVRVARQITHSTTPQECIGDDYDELVAEGEAQAKVLLNLHSKYHIHTPPCYFVVGDVTGFRSESHTPLLGQYSLYQAVEKVTGPDLNDLLHTFKEDNQASTKQTVEPQLDELMCSLIRYLVDHINSNTPFMFDLFKLTQYVYGTTHSAEIPAIYLVDTEVLLEDVTKANVLGAIEQVEVMINMIQAFIRADLNKVKVAYKDLIKIKNTLEKST